MKNKIMNGIIVLEILTLIGLGIYIVIDIKSDKKIDDVENDKEYISLNEYEKKEIGEVYKIEKDGLVYITDKKGKIKEIGTDIFIYGEYFPGYYAIKKQNEDVYSLYYSDDFITNNQEGNTYKGKNSDKYVYFPLENKEINHLRYTVENAAGVFENVYVPVYYFNSIDKTIIWNYENGKSTFTNLENIEVLICGNDCSFNGNIIAYSEEEKNGSILYDVNELEPIFNYNINTYVMSDRNNSYGQSIDNNNYFSFCKNDQCGVGDRNGKLLIPIEYSSTFVFNDSLVLVSKGNLTSFERDTKLGSTGTSGISYSMLYRTKMDGELFGIVNLKNEIVIPIVYEYLEVLDLGNLILAKKDGKYGVINYKNEIIVDFECETLPDKYEVYTFGSRNYFYFNGDIYDLITKEKLVTDIQESYDFTESYLVYSKAGKIIIYSTNEHKIIVPKNFTSLTGGVSRSPLRGKNYSYSWGIWGGFHPMCHCLLNEGEDGTLSIPYDYYYGGAYLLRKDGNIEVLPDYKCCDWQS